ncbi:MAG: TolC family protein [Massilia sp.]|nr:TolC family protein [Massilia sp.]
MSVFSRAGSCLACAALAACAGAVPPAQHFAQPAVPALWSGQAARPAQLGADVVWGGIFDDATLTSLIQRASAENLDIWLANARLRESRAQSGLASAAGQATLDFTGSYARERDSQNAPRKVQVSRSGEVEPSSGGMDNLFQTGFDASWEMDAFDARAHARAAAHADLQALTFERAAIERTLCAEVARNYVLLRQFQQQLLIARSDLDAQNDAQALAESRRSAGLATGTDVARGAAQSARLEAQVALLALEAKKAVHRIAVLLGAPPHALLAELRAPGPIPHARGDVAIALPSELLRRRPDIARAERQLAAATERREVAIADLFPRISLVGTAGLASVSARDLFSSASLLTRIGPSITWPILRRDQISATIEIRGAQEEQAFIIYRKAILNAFDEVENALAEAAAAKARAPALAAVVQHSALALELAQARNRGGLADFRTVLDALHGAAQARSDQLANEAALATAAIALFKSAGGSWESSAPAPDTTPRTPHLLHMPPKG